MRRLLVSGRLLGLALLAMTVGGCDGRPSRSRDESSPSLGAGGHVAVVNLRGGLPEGAVGGGFFPVPASQTYVGLVRGLYRMHGDDSVKGLFVKLGPAVGFHHAAELGDSLLALRKSGRTIVCHAHELNNSAMWLARRGCDEIWVSAAGDVPTVGIGAELSYLKGAFDKFGIQADMLAMGKYKSGGESLTREGPGEDSLRNLKETLADLRSQWLSGVSHGAKDAALAKKQVEDGPWSPAAAKKLGLITHVGFEDEALRSIKKRAQTDETESLYGPGSGQKSESPVAEIVRAIAGASDKGAGKKRIAFVPAVGSITMGSGGMFGDGGITAGSMTRTIRRLREDDSVQAIVLRMDSPGGSPLASDLIWREVMLTRDKKPVIISVGSMAASGGYYIAAAGTKIVASSTAIVGSIGVFGGKIVLGGAFEKVGITSYPVAASPEPGADKRATHLSPMSPWDDATRERVRQSMRRIYDLFVERVAEGRGMDPKAVYETAEGEIFLATTGKKRGLVDQLGGVGDAIALARREAGLNENVPVVLEGAGESLMESLFLGPEPEAGEVELALKNVGQRAAREIVFEPAIVDGLRPFQAILAPLVSGESVVTALPYSLTIH